MKYIKQCRLNELVCDIGITDIQSSTNTIRQLYYYVWKGMLTRCYSLKYQLKEPTYIGCSVCDEWKYLSNFKKWFDKNYIEGYHLDKDILIDGNKIYSPDTCCFVPKYINSLYTNSGQTRGKYLIGVSFAKKVNKYQSNVSINNKQTFLGYFDSELEAHNAWLKAKREYARKLAINAYMNNEIDERIMNAIIIKAYNLK